MRGPLLHRRRPGSTPRPSTSAHPCSRKFGIYLCGGSRLAGEPLDEIDWLVITAYPIAYGTGMPMFGSGFDVTEFARDEVRTFGDGALVRTYGRKR